MNKFSSSFLFLVSVATTIGGAQAKEHTVKVITDYDNMRMYFDPLNITIQKGDTVTWINQADEDHNIITFPDGFPIKGKGFESPYLTKKDEKWSHTFDAVGTYNYHCIPHLFMGMRGNVIVDQASSPEDHHTPSKEEVYTYREKLLKFFDKTEFEHAPDYVRAKKKALLEQ